MIGRYECCLLLGRNVWEEGGAGFILVPCPVAKVLYLTLPYLGSDSGRWFRSHAIRYLLLSLHLGGFSSFHDATRILKMKGISSWADNDEHGN